MEMGLSVSPLVHSSLRRLPHPSRPPLFICEMPYLVAMDEDSGGGWHRGGAHETLAILLSLSPETQLSPLHSGLLKGTFCGTYRSDLIETKDLCRCNFRY